MFTSPNFFFFFYWTKIDISIALFALRTGLLRQAMTHRCIFLLSWTVIFPLTPPNPFTDGIWKKKIKTSARKSTKNTNYCKSIGSLNLQSCCYTVTTVVLVLRFSGQTLRQMSQRKISFSFLALLGNNTTCQFRFCSADGKVGTHLWERMYITDCSFSYYWTVSGLFGSFTLIRDTTFSSPLWKMDILSQQWVKTHFPNRVHFLEGDSASKRESSGNSLASKSFWRRSGWRTECPVKAILNGREKALAERQRRWKMFP